MLKMLKRNVDNIYPFIVSVAVAAFLIVSTMGFEDKLPQDAEYCNDVKAGTHTAYNKCD